MRVTSTSSSAQPVIAIDPVTPEALLVGVSTDPIGAAVLVVAIRFSVTWIGLTTFDVPWTAMVTVAVPPLAGAVAPFTVTLNAPDPAPAAGETCIHATFDVAD